MNKADFIKRLDDIREELKSPYARRVEDCIRRGVEPPTSSGLMVWSDKMSKQTFSNFLNLLTEFLSELKDDG